MASFKFQGHELRFAIALSPVQLQSNGIHYVTPYEQNLH